MTSTVTLRTDFNGASFAPYGTVIERPAEPGQRNILTPMLAASELAPVYHTNHVPPSILPHSVSRLERHPHAAQAFVPFDVSRYLVTVAPSGDNGAPRLGETQSFLVPGTVGVIYGRGVWHAGATVLDRLGSFAVLMWRGAPDDDVFADIPPLILTLDQALEPQPA